MSATKNIKKNISSTTIQSPLVSTLLTNKKKNIDNTNTTNNNNNDVTTNESFKSNNTKKKKHNNSNNHQQDNKLSKKAKKEAEELIQEQKLAALLFGGDSNDNNYEDDDDDDNNNNMKKKVKATNKKQNKSIVESNNDEFGFEIDRVGEDNISSNNNDEDNDDNDDDSVHQMNDNNNNNNNNIETTLNEIIESNIESNNNKPIWFDNDDNELKLNILDPNNIRLRKLRTTRYENNITNISGNEIQDRLRNRYISTTQLTSNTNWAKINQNDNNENQDNDNEDNNEDNNDNEDKSSSVPLLLSSLTNNSTNNNNNNNKRLKANIIDIIRCPDANYNEPNNSVVQAISFNQGSINIDKPLLITAGLDKTLRFFQCSKDNSTKVHGIHFPTLPIYSASFLGNTGKVVVSGRRSFFYIYDANIGKLDYVPKILDGRNDKSLEKCIVSPCGKIIAFCGNDGYIILIDSYTKTHMYNLKINGSVRAITFTTNTNELLASGSDGDIYTFDLRTRKCIERFSNNDGTITSSIAYSCNGHMAVGSESGVVNLYESTKQLYNINTNNNNNSAINNNNIIHQYPYQPQQRIPIKSIMNIKTSVDNIKFNHDGQILCISSQRDNNNSLRLIHVPTATVFSNWPTTKTPLKQIFSIDFSPNSKFIAIGNDRGNCRLYSLKHYN